MHLIKGIFANVFLVFIAIVNECVCAPSKATKNDKGDVTFSCNNVNTNNVYKQAKEKIAKHIEVLGDYYERKLNAIPSDGTSSFFQENFLFHVSQLAFNVGENKIGLNIIKNGKEIRKVAQKIGTMDTTHASIQIKPKDGVISITNPKSSADDVSQGLQVHMLVPNEDIQMLQPSVKNVLHKEIDVEVKVMKEVDEVEKVEKVENKKIELLRLAKALNQATLSYMFELNGNRVKTNCLRMRSFSIPMDKPTKLKEQLKRTKSLDAPITTEIRTTSITKEGYNKYTDFYTFEIDTFTGAKEETIACPNFGRLVNELTKEMENHHEVIKTEFTLSQSPLRVDENEWVQRISTTFNTSFFDKFNKRLSFLLPEHMEELKKYQKQTIINIPAIIENIELRMRESAEKSFGETLHLHVIQEGIQIMRRENILHVSYQSPINIEVLKQAQLKPKGLTSDEINVLTNAISIGEKVEKLYGTFIKYYIMKRWNQYCSKLKVIKLSLDIKEDGESASCYKPEVNRKLKQIETSGVKLAKGFHDLALKLKSTYADLLKVLTQQYNEHYQLGAETITLTKMLSEVFGEKEFSDEKYKTHVRKVDQAGIKIRNFLDEVINSIQKGSLGEVDSLKRNKYKIRDRYPTTGEKTIEIELAYKLMNSPQDFYPSRKVSLNPDYEKILNLHDDLHTAAIEYDFYKKALPYCKL